MCTSRIDSFFFNLSHLRQVYLVVSKQEEQAHSFFPAILFRMKSFAHAKSMERADLWERYNLYHLYHLYVTYAFGSAHVKFDVCIEVELLPFYSTGAVE